MERGKGGGGGVGRSVHCFLCVMSQICGQISGRCKPLFALS